MKSGVTQSINRVAEVMRACDLLTEHEVLVGVPAEKGARPKDENGEYQPGMTNAALAYIHDKGSPAANIPARPFMGPGINEAMPAIIEKQKEGAKLVLQGDESAITRMHNSTGMLAQNSIRKVITDGEGFEGLSEKTLAARKRRGRKGTKPLIDTSQMRKSITYVVRRKGQTK